MTYRANTRSDCASDLRTVARDMNKLLARHELPAIKWPSFDYLENVDYWVGAIEKALERLNGTLELAKADLAVANIEITRSSGRPITVHQSVHDYWVCLGPVKVEPFEDELDAHKAAHALAIKHLLGLRAPNEKA